jgi:hypothetical protein
MKKDTKMNPYLKTAELKPCEFCKLTRKGHTNITSMIDDKNLKVVQNKNNISTKKIFGNDPKKTKKNKKSKY